MKVVITTSEYCNHHDIPPAITVTMFDLSTEGKEAEQLLKEQ